MLKTISLCMIVKNEDKYIGNCLKSIHDLVDEIIIVDTGSTDKTKEICSKYTDNVFDFEWDNNFADARNYSFSKATCDYILWLDADDILLNTDRDKFKELKNNLNCDQVSMIYNYSFNEYGNPSLSFRRNRLVKRSINPTWIGFVHEIIDLDITDSYNSDICITHTRTHSNSDRNLKIFESKRRSGEIFNARNTLYYAKELFYNGKYQFAINEFNKFLKFEDCWIEDKIDTYIKLYECHTELDKKYPIRTQQINSRERRRNILFETFKLTYPRAEALYRIATTYVEEERYYEAILYLESIFTTQFPENCAGFINKDMWTILPHLQLCFCYYQVGNIKLSLEHHDKCMELSPNNEHVKSNEEYFKHIRR